MRFIPHVIAVHVVGTVIALAKVYQPGCLPMPVPQAFTVHIEVVPHVGMKYQCQHGKAYAGDLIWISGQSKLVRAVFIDQEKPRLRLRDRSHVIVLSRFGADRNAEWIE